MIGLWIGLLAAGCGKGPDSADSAAALDSEPAVIDGTDDGSDGGDSGGTGDSGGAGDDGGVDSAPPPEGCEDSNPAPLAVGTCVLQAPCAWTSDQEGAYSGYAVAAGDLDGDGLEDVIIGAPYRDGDAGSNAGQVRVLSGALITDPDPLLLTLEGQEVDERFGTSLTMVGDATGDGVADLLISAPADDEVDTYAGEVYLLTGGDLAVAASWRGESSYSYAGHRVDGAGDMDGDGLAELLIAGERKELDPDDSSEDNAAGRVYLLRGRSSGWGLDGSLADADVTVDGEASYEMLGQGMAGGDLDGDGAADLAVGAPYGGSYRGQVYVFSGGALSDGALAAGDAPVQLYGEDTYDAFGWSMTMGDLDGDGFDELAVGAPLSDMSWPEGGAVAVYSGGPGFFSDGPALLATWGGSFDDEQLGYGLTAGDAGGDGLEDLVVGALYARTGLLTRGGRAHLFAGRTSGWETGADAMSADATFHPAGAGDYLGTANALGDLDGDGKDELLLASGFADYNDYDNIGWVYLFWGE